MKRLSRWGWNVLVALDQLAGAIFLGNDPDETISSRAAKAKTEGRRWGCVLCRVLDWFDRDHCAKALEPDEGKNTVARL